MQLNVKNEGKRWPQVLCMVIVSLGCFSVGLHWSWSSPFSLVLSQDKINYNISEEETSYFLIFQPLGMMIFSPFYYKISEYLGTKKSLWMLGIPHLLSWITAAVSTSKWEFYTSRFLAGVADAVFFCAGPPYIGEVTTPTIRGYWGFMPIFAVYLGALIITALAIYLDVIISSCINMVPSILFLLMMWFLPESPYQLIKDGKFEQAKECLKWLRRKSDVEEDFMHIKTAVESSLAHKSKFKELLTVKSNRRGLRAGVLVRCGQQFSGISIFMNYSQMIFLKVGGNFSPQVSSMVFLATAAGFNVICSSLIERFGRKVTFITSAFACGIVLILMSSYFFLDEYNLVNLEGLEWFPLMGLILFIIVYSPGVGIIPTLMLGELFTGSTKYKSLCVLSGAFAVAVLLTAMFFNLLNAYVGLYGPFLVYGLSCLVSGALALRWMPETKGKTLEEIQQNLQSR
ncbi:facilitated trehalose transporter Tret1-like [Euwallacea fornicatus]|uniref:facilitated trehalose transporter Tret1-like n=1 Tax=Euwallacea fornicatus TaxID=995702 RepID=UPI00338F7FF4